MKTKKGLIITVLFLSVGYLIYNYIFTDIRYGMMMYHHYGYYDDYTRTQFYLKSTLNVIAYLVILVSFVLLLLDKMKSEKGHLNILHKRLADGDISLEEFQELKKAIER